MATSYGPTASEQDIGLIQLAVRGLVRATDRRATKPGSVPFFDQHVDGTTLAARWPAIGRFLTTAGGDGPCWRRVPDLRTRIRSWESSLSPTTHERYWPLYLRRAGLLLPEEHDATKSAVAERRASMSVARDLNGRIVLPAHRPLVGAAATELGSDYDHFNTFAPTPDGTFAEMYRSDAVLQRVAANRPIVGSWIGSSINRVIDPEHREPLSRVVDDWRARYSRGPMHQFVAEHLDRLIHDERSRPRLAALLYRAVKAEVWLRAVDYLTSETDETDETSSDPALRRALYVRPAWMEQPTPPNDPLFDWLSPEPPKQDNTSGQPEHRLAMALELAHADLHPHQIVDAGPRANWQLPRTTVIDRLLNRIVALLYVDDNVEALLLRGQRRSHDLIRIDPSAPTKNEAPRRPTGRRDEKVRSELAVLAELSDEFLQETHVQSIRDPLSAHAIITALREGAGGAQRQDLTRKLVTGIVTQILDMEAPDPLWVEAQMRVLNSATWDLAANEEPTLPRIVAQTSSVVSPADSPFTATLYRCLATLATKRKDHDAALAFIMHADKTINASRPQPGQSDVFRINTIESLQQVKLQMGGALVRALESLLTSPRHLREPESSVVAPRAISLAVWTRNELTEAYNALVHLERDGLPATPDPDRVSSPAWRFNARHQLIRAILLSALVTAATRTGLAIDEDLEMALHVYREATTAATGTAHHCLLTQVALLYAFLTHGTIPRPDDHAPAQLPTHLAHRHYAADGLDYLDIEDASQYLYRNGYDAGVLATLRWPAALRALIEPPGNADSDRALYVGWRFRWDPHAQKDMSNVLRKLGDEKPTTIAIGNLRQDRNTTFRQESKYFFFRSQSA
jgi:hypothetical protein